MEQFIFTKTYQGENNLEISTRSENVRRSTLKIHISFPYLYEIENTAGLGSQNSDFWVGMKSWNSDAGEEGESASVPEGSW